MKFGKKLAQWYRASCQLKQIIDAGRQPLINLSILCSIELIRIDACKAMDVHIEEYEYSQCFKNRLTGWRSVFGRTH